MKKKLVMILMASAVAASLSACGKNSDSKETSSTETTQEATTEVESTTQEKVSDRADYIPIEELDMDEYLTLPDYKNMEIDVEKKEVTDSNIEDYINKELLSACEIKDREVKDGDITSIDFVGKLDGEEFDGGSAEGYQLRIGSGSFIDGFEDGLIGVKPGETVDLNLKFPDPYDNNPDLAGKDVVFTVTVNSILESKKYEDIDDKSIKEFNIGYDSKKALWDEAKKEVTEQYEAEYEDNAVSAIGNWLLQNTEFKSVPQHLVDEAMESQNSYYASLAGMYGMDLESYVSASGMTMDDYNTAMDGMSQNLVKQYLLMEAIAREEGITVTDEDLTAQAQKDLETYSGYYDSAEDLIENAGRADYRMNIVQNLVMDKLKGIVKINIVEPSTEEEQEGHAEQENADETEQTGTDESSEEEKVSEEASTDKN